MGSKYLSHWVNKFIRRDTHLVDGLGACRLVWPAFGLGNLFAHRSSQTYCDACRWLRKEVGMSE